jgi:hypothetical protein
MSVPKHRRGISGMEFYRIARDLRNKLTQKLLSDFGIKSKVRQIHIYGDRILRDDGRLNTDEDYDDTETIVVEHTKNKTKELTIIESYPKWLMDMFRMNIMNALRRLMYDITMANSIFPTADYELAERRLWQDRAICECEYLIQEIEYAGDIMPVKYSTLMEYADDLMRLIALLRGWRSANKRLMEKLNRMGTRQTNTIKENVDKKEYRKR